MDKAVDSVEYVIRHKGAPHLKSVAHQLNWYQYYSVDVILFITFVTLLFIKVSYFVIRKLLCKKKKQKSKQKAN